MTEIELDCNYIDVAKLCEKYIGPRTFYLHNQIGGKGWNVRPRVSRSGGQWAQGCLAKFDNPKMATFIMLQKK